MIPRKHIRNTRLCSASLCLSQSLSKKKEKVGPPWESAQMSVHLLALLFSGAHTEKSRRLFLDSFPFLLFLTFNFSYIT